jgi:hypothetical protein
LMSVVFPAPFGPRIPNISPSLIFRFMPFSASMKGPREPLMASIIAPNEPTFPRAEGPLGIPAVASLELVGYLLIRSMVSIAYFKILSLLSDESRTGNDGVKPYRLVFGKRS